MQEALNACSIGASIPKQDSGINLPVGAFQGQMGCIYLFDDIISAGEGLSVELHRGSEAADACS